MPQRIFLFTYFMLLNLSALHAVRFEVSDEEIDRQEITYNSQHNFDYAFREAIALYLYNHDDQESFLSLMLERYHDKAHALVELNKLMNNSDTVLRLVTPNDEIQAPRGENINENWIFSLNVKNFDHSFWVIVPRYESHAAYSYGFN